jgi:hypothetical protein
VAVGGGILCWGVGRWLGHFLARRQGFGRRGGVLRNLGILLPGGLLGLLWAALLFGAWRLGVWGIRGALGAQESIYFHQWFELPLLGAFLLMLIAVPFGGSVTWKAASVHLRRVQQRQGIAGG